MKITDLKCTVMGQNPVVRITTDKGIDGYAQAENSKPFHPSVQVLMQPGDDVLIVLTMAVGSGRTHTRPVYGVLALPETVPQAVHDHRQSHSPSG